MLGLAAAAAGADMLSKPRAREVASIMPARVRLFMDMPWLMSNNDSSERQTNSRDPAGEYPDTRW